MNDSIPYLPPKQSIALETPAVLRQLARANRALAELKGTVTAIPNASILISTLVLQEARDSSTIENIVTTQDELYKGGVIEEGVASAAAKEVHRYARALNAGYEILRAKKILRSSDIIEIHGELCETETGYRKLPGTVLKNVATGQVIYQPPQDPAVIERLMSNFLDAFHDAEQWGVDPLVQMAVLHYQFESIHPFYDGNGRTGRILNLLHLVLHGLLDVPILYLSRAILNDKEVYYELLQRVRTEGCWEDWVLYMLRAVEKTSIETLQKVVAIRALMNTCKQRLRTENPKVYSQELLNNLFRHPYTKVELVMRDCNVSRPTASKNLSILEAMGLLQKKKVHRVNIYVHTALFALLSE